MTWLFISNDYGRTIRRRNACALAAVSLALVAIDNPSIGQNGLPTQANAHSQSQQNQSQQTPLRSYQTNTYQLPAPREQNLGRSASQVANFPVSGDLSASPWSQSQTPNNTIPAQQNVPSRMVNYLPSNANLSASPGNEYVQDLTGPKVEPQTPVATLSWGAIHPLPANNPTTAGIANGNMSGYRLSPEGAVASSGNAPIVDGQFYGLGAPQPVNRSVQSQQVSSSTELMNNAQPGIPAGGIPISPQPDIQFGTDQSSNLSIPTAPDREMRDNRYREIEKQSTAPNSLSVAAPMSAVKEAEPIQSIPATPDPRWIAEQEQLKSRRELAEKVSNDILSTSPPSNSSSIRPLESPAGWSSVEQDLRVHMEKCEQLLRRNAIHSGREEIVMGMRRLTRMLDALTGMPKCEPALDSALTAMREESEFQHAEGIVSIQDLVASHSTPSLKNVNLKDVTAETASQHYRHYARQQFVLSSEQHPWAADLLYAYGKTLEKEADATFESSIRLRSQAVICYQAALQIRQGHPSASSQLGYSLLKLDRIDEAEQILSFAVQQSPNSSNWSNLAEVLRRRGAMQQSQYALAQASHYSPQTSQYTPDNPEVTQVNAAEFARYSPALNATAPVSTSVQQSAKPAEPVKSANIFSNLFR